MLTTSQDLPLVMLSTCGNGRSIGENPLSLNATKAQLEFLRKIDELDLSTDDTRMANYDCDMGELNGIAVCVTDANDTASSSSGGVSSGSSKRTEGIISGVCGGFAALGLISALLLYHKRRRDDATNKDIQSMATPEIGSTLTATI